MVLILMLLVVAGVSSAGVTVVYSVSVLVLRGEGKLSTVAMLVIVVLAADVVLLGNGAYEYGARFVVAATSFAPLDDDTAVDWLEVAASLVVKNEGGSDVNPLTVGASCVDELAIVLLDMPSSQSAAAIVALLNLRSGPAVVREAQNDSIRMLTRESILVASVDGSVSWRCLVL